MKDLIEKVDRTIDWHWLSRTAEWVIDQSIKVQQIPAPTFAEGPRAAYVADQFRAFGLADVEIDSLQNVYGRVIGANAAAPALMISAHTDTVFPASTDLSVRRDNDLIYGPGLGDNSMGVAGLLGVLHALRETGLTPACDLWCVATTGEEGLGDLCGMRAAFNRLDGRIGAVINLEGLAFGHIYHAGIAVKRLRITAHTDGGHSWLHFGRPSAVHGIVELGSRILALKPGNSPRTTYNIGLIEGGQSINTIAAKASMWLDMRSEQTRALDVLEQDVRKLINSLQSKDLRFEIEVVGDRPAGQIAPDHPLVHGALVALSRVGVQGMLETGSTDGNIPLSAGTPTVTVGITRGGNAHRLDEFVETGPVADGMRQLFMLVLAAAEYQAR